MDVIFGEPETNFQSIVDMIDDVKPSSNTLVVVPELFLTGYHKESINRIGKTLEDSNYVEKIKNLVKKNDIKFYGSLPIKFDGMMYNTAILVSSDGVVGHYKKSHLFGPMGEKELFKAGKDVSTVDLDGINYGLSICYDLRFPELYQIQAINGSQLLLIVAEWPITRVDHWRSLLKARAIENQCFVVGVNCVGSDPDYEYGGHSAVFSPYGKMIVGMNHAEEEIKEVSLNLSEVDKFRNQFDVRMDKWINQ